MKILRDLSMLRILFLILVAMCSIALAQTQEKKDSYKFFEYERISDNLLKEKIQFFCNEVDKTSWVGWIINYGIPKEVSSREKQLRDTGMCTKEFPSPRVIFLRIEDKNKSKTEFWIVPPDKQPPVMQTK